MSKTAKANPRTPPTTTTRIAAARLAVEAAYEVPDDAITRLDAHRPGSLYQKLSRPLFTDAMRAALPTIGEIDNDADPTVYYRYFCVWHAATWHIAAYAMHGAEIVLYGWCDLGDPDDAEFGPVALSELREIQCRRIRELRVELDRNFAPCPLSQVVTAGAS